MEVHTQPPLAEDYHLCAHWHPSKQETSTAASFSLLVGNGHRENPTGLLFTLQLKRPL